MDASFEGFLQRPENQVLVEAYQRKEAEHALKQKANAEAVAFRDKVLGTDTETQKAIAPYLKIPALRAVIQTFTNDAGGDFGKWAGNPEVQRILKAAKTIVDECAVSEPEMLEKLNYCMEGSGSAKEMNQKVMLSMEHLAPALNEHLLERRRGNDNYKQANFEAAEHHYKRAKAMLDFIRAENVDEQAEIDANMVAVLLNLAALHLADEKAREAADCCTEVLELEPGNAKALLRRAKASIKLHKFQEAEDDLQRLLSIGGYEKECKIVRQTLARVKAAGQRSDAALYTKMVTLAI